MDTIKCNLSTKSFRDAANKIRKYREELESKCQQFCKELIEAGAEVTTAVLQQHVDTGLTIGSLEIIEEGSDGNYSARLVVSSDAILFLEFGSGLIGQGTADHAGKFGYGSGTYPGKGHWDDTDVWVNYGGGLRVHHEYGWVYYGDDGKKHFSEGMVASMPMYQGGEEMKRKLDEIKDRVFKW